MVISHQCFSLIPYLLLSLFLKSIKTLNILLLHTITLSNTYCRTWPLIYQGATTGARWGRKKIIPSKENFDQQDTRDRGSSKFLPFLPALKDDLPQEEWL